MTRYASAGNPQSLNLYAYAGNDPINGFDPDGHSLYSLGDGTYDDLTDLQQHIMNLVIANDQARPASNNQSAVCNSWLCSVTQWLRNNVSVGGGSDTQGIFDKTAFQSVFAAESQQQNSTSTSQPAAQHGHFEYDQKTGQMTHLLPDGTRVAVGTGYSGQGDGLNNPSEQYTPNSGPIPQGSYTIEPQRDNVTGAGHKLPGSMRLNPTSDTDTHGRAGFLIHGDNLRGDHSASNGCIILPRPARNNIGGSSDHTLVVVP